MGFRQILIAVLFSVLMILCLLPGFAGLIAKDAGPDAQNGILKLSGWDFSKDGNVSLDGTWAFYWDKLLAPGEFDGTEPTGYYSVPKYWSKYDKLKLPSNGFATYRLIITGMSQCLYSIKTPEIYTEYALWINGKRIDACGSFSGESPIYLHPHVHDFYSQSGEIEIVLQVKNSAHIYAGIGQSIRLGPPELIHREYDLEAGTDLALISICIFAGFYCLIFFLFRRNSRELPWFSALCLAVGVRNMFSNATLVMQAIPDFPFWLGSKIVTLTIPLIIVSMFFYTHILFPKIMPKILFRLFLWLNILYGLMVLFLPSLIYSYVFSPYLLIVGAACVLGIYIFVRAVMDREKDAAFFLPGMLLLSAGALIDSLNYLQILSARYILSDALSCFIIIQVILLAKRYSEAFRHAERLSEDLKISLDKTMNTETAYLSAQMKPHFLYNALNAIAETCETDPSKAERLILSLSKYLRQTLDYDNLSGIVPLKKEVELLYAYTAIEEARFADIETVFDFPDPIPSLQLPPLTLQPLVENAIRHGLCKKRGGGNVLVKMEYRDKGVLFTVKDNGAGIPDKILQNLAVLPSGSVSIGLYNINSRLMRLYGKGLSITSEIGAGTSVNFEIPYRKEN